MAVRIDPNTLQLKDQVVSINRVTKVVKGGKNLSFSALVVVGDGGGHVGYGAGKAREVPMAIRKGIEAAKKSLVKVNITSTSIPHAVLGRYGAGRVLLRPEHLDVRAVVDTVVSRWSGRLDKPHSIGRRVARGLPEITADRRWLTLSLWLWRTGT